MSASVTNPSFRAFREHFVKVDPSNATWQRDLSLTHAKLALLFWMMEGRAHLSEGRAIIAGLVRLFPEWVEWKHELAWFDDRIAELQR